MIELISALLPLLHLGNLPVLVRQELMRYATLVKNGVIKRDGGWLMDVDMTDWSTAADLAAKAGYCPDGSVGEIGVARMAEAEKAAAEWAENVQRLTSWRT